MFDYVVAADGLHLHARREEIEVTMPLAHAEIRGLSPLMPLFGFRPPKVPDYLVRQMLDEANSYADSRLETLFHLCWSDLNIYDQGWQKLSPEQSRSHSSCRPLEDGPGSSHERAILDIHSHHSMPARFSPTDDREETGFRLYGVIGRLGEAPEIRMRVGVYGYFWEIPASWVMELPEGLRDCKEEE